jgi:hypothetical protein
MMAAVNGHALLLHSLLRMPELKAIINWQNLDGETALHRAAFFGHLAAAEVLIFHGAESQMENGVGIPGLRGSPVFQCGASHLL